jgi:hypothetical protein
MSIKIYTGYFTNDSKPGGIEKESNQQYISKVNVAILNIVLF